MREGSHFDGHQTTGYNLHKRISGLEGLGATVSFSRGRYWRGPHKRRYVVVF
ncbi:hypothetical protein SAMN05216525_11111 [Bradyrhizobium sp. Gha]|nr:hypothetical protein SAMN05216525_11111 [Bradyrhizobium sp. Gha]